MQRITIRINVENWRGYDKISLEVDSDLHSP